MSSGGEMTTAQYLIFVAPFLGTVLIVFGMKYFSAVSQARARLANDSMYRGLAERAVATQSDNQAALDAIRAELTGVATTLAAVQQILQQVE